MADAAPFGSPRRAAAWMLLSVAVAAHVAVVSSILVSERPVIWALHNDTIHRTGRGADFYAVYHAAISLQRGQDPYAVNPDGVTPYFYAFRYLPAVAMAAQPLTALTPVTAYVVWVAVLEALLVVLVITLWRWLPATPTRTIAVAVLLVNSPYFLELYMGQFTFAAAALCVLALRLPGGALWFTGSVLLKPFTLAALPALVTARRYRWHALVALACVIGFSWPYFTRHPVQRNIFLDANFNPVGGMGIGNVGAMRVLSLALEDSGLTWLSARATAWVSALRLAVLGLTAVLALRSRARSATPGVCALLVAHFLTYQQVWEHHMSAVIVFGVLLAAAAPTSAVRVLVLTSLCVLALPTPFAWFDVAKDPAVFDPSGDWPRAALYAVALSKALPTLALFVAAVSTIRRDGLMPLRDALRLSRFTS